MARYTDIDLLIETVEETDWYHINKNGELCRGANSKDDIPLYKHSDIKEVLNNAPIADVVPKSEADNLIKVIDNTTQQFLALHDLYQNAKAEVAREIFEEIDELLSPYGSYIKTIDLEEYAELKKKYTEEKKDEA